MYTQRTMLAMAAMQMAALLALAAPAQAQPANCNGRSLSNGGTIVPQNTPFTVSGTVTSAQGVYYPVTASAAASYTFTFCSNGGSSNYDPWLCLYDSAGVLITQNDDSCGLQSQIVANLAAGSYYIAVSGFSSSAGSYTMAYLAPGVVPNASPTAPTGLQQAAVAGGPAMPVGFVSNATIFFRGAVTDPDAGDVVGVQVEVLPSTSAFNPTTITGQTAQTAANALVASGSVAECAFTFTGNPFGSGDYHWRLRGIDGDGATSAWVVFNAAPSHFTADLDAPSIPTPLKPLQGDGVGVNPPLGEVGFQWLPSSDVGPGGALSYRVQVSASPGFATTLADDVVSGTEHAVNLPIAAFPYFWQVAAIDPAGNQSAFSPAISFLVIFDDGVNHSSGDCNISASGAPGNVLAVFAALAILAALFRRR